jgi:formylglycine-generating enzyme required for sulfatase activity
LPLTQYDKSWYTYDKEFKMEKRKTQDATGEDAKPGGWRERLSSLFRRPSVKGDTNAQLPTKERTPPSPLLSDDELNLAKTSYMSHLHERYNTMHIFGLDARRRAMQESGQVLDFFALYIPLNTTLEAPADQEPSKADARLVGLPKTHPLSLLQVVGQERKVLVRGTIGSSRSTFVRFLALSLAERSANGEHPGLARLEPEWTHRWMLPLLVDLDDLGASGHDDGTADGLLAYISAELGLFPDQVQTQVIEPGGALFLLDGIESATEAVQDFVCRFAHTANHFVVTAQEYTDLTVATTCLLEGFTKVQVAPLTFEQMDMFVRRWYAELERKGWVDEETARSAPGQLCTLLRRDDVLALTQRPSMLLLITLLHTLRGRLPQDRVTFYHELINLAIAHWIEGKTKNERDLRQVFDGEDLRAAVAQATYQAYTRLDHPIALVELGENDLRAALVNACHAEQWQAIGDLVARISNRPGILEKYRPGVYTYPHPSLQAYVASRHLAVQPDLPRAISRLAHEDFYRWREVIPFAIGRVTKLDHNLAVALEVVNALCAHPTPADDPQQAIPDPWRMAWLAGESLAEIEAEIRENAASPGDPAYATLDRVRHGLAALLDRGMLTPPERTKVGSVLSCLPGGDPRPGVCQLEQVWCECPASPFWQGEGEAAHVVELDTFWIARYPVTNAQYAFYVRATGHKPPGHWRGDSHPAEISNHPVVQVTWQDAMDFCQWLSNRVRSQELQAWRLGQIEMSEPRFRDWTVRLPTSAEWEKAARGGLLIPTPEGDGLADNPLPRRVYPWGDAWQPSTAGIQGDETRGNFSESDIGTTTPVGMYPSGASPYGVLDMAGNVWEWCCDWTDETQRYKVRRGGAFRYTHEHARCSAYDKAHPGLGWPYVGFRVVLAPHTRQLAERETQTAPS